MKTNPEKTIKHGTWLLTTHKKKFVEINPYMNEIMASYIFTTGSYSRTCGSTLHVCFFKSVSYYLLPQLISDIIIEVNDLELISTRI